MRRRLVIFTISYPFGSGETFLQDEVEALRTKFRSVLIQPLFQAPGIRSLPQGVEVAEPVVGLDRRKQLFYLAIRRPLAVVNLLRAAGLHRWATQGSRLRSARILLFFAILRSGLLNSEGVKHALSAPEETVAYAFWGAECALAIPTLNEAGVHTVVRYHSYDLYIERSDLIESRPVLPWWYEIATSARLAVFVSKHGHAYFDRVLREATRDPPVSRVCALGSPDMGVRPPKAPDSTFHVVSCSSIVPVKRVHLVARLVKELATCRQVEWFHFGGGMTDELANELRSFPSQVSVHMAGHVDRKVIFDHYRDRHVDLFLNLSLHEGVPVSIMEAISFDIPIAATRVGGTEELVVEGVTGFLIEEPELHTMDILAARIMKVFGKDGASGKLCPRSFWANQFQAPATVEQLYRYICDADLTDQLLVREVLN